MSKQLTNTNLFNLFDKCKKGTQKYILAEIFSENQGIVITKSEIETQMTLKWVFRDVDEHTKFNKIEFFRQRKSVPGDIQRNLRSFHDQFNKYGLEKIEKSESPNGELYYKWNPITMDKLEDIIHPEARNIFKTEDDINRFIKTKNYTCEICGACKSDNKTLRMAVDHWRAHSIYSIDNTNIAVLLCEKCNNIHHNHDASKIALKYKDNMSIIKKWIKKEKEIRSYGFLPNDNDLKTQIIVKQSITDYYKTLSPICEDFWEELF